MRGLNLLTRASPALADAVVMDRESSGVAAHRRPAANLEALAARRLGEQILARNIFESRPEAAPQDAVQAPAEPAPEPETPPADAPVPRCSAGLRLVASIVDAARPERSLAAVRKDERMHLLAPGTQLDDLTLVTVRPAYAYLHSTTGALCSLAVFASPGERANGEPKPAAPPPVQESKPASKSKAFFSSEELERGVRPLGRRGYSVARALVIKALTDPGKASAGALFRAVDRNGRSDGMEVRAVRDESLLRRMGIQSGDVVRSLNGADLTTPTGLLGALRAVREADTVTIEIRRGDAVQSLQYLLD